MRLFFRVSIYVVLLFFLSVIVIVAAYLFTSLPERQINGVLADLIYRQAGLHFRVHKINRDIWNRLCLEGVSIELARGHRTLLDVHADVVDINYSVVSLLKRHPLVHRLSISGLSAKVDPALFSGNGGRGSRDGALPPLVVDTFVINNANLTWTGKKTPVAADIEYARGAFWLSADNSKLRLDSLSGKLLPETVVVNHLAAILSQAGTRLELVSFSLTTPNSQIELSGQLAEAKEPKFDIVFHADLSSFADLARIAGVDIRGKAAVEGKLMGDVDSFRAKVSGNIEIMGEPVENARFDLAYSQSELRLTGFNGEVFGAMVIGDGWITPKTNPVFFGFSGTVKSFNLENVGAGVKTNFSGKVALRGQGLSERELRMSVEADLADVSIDMYHFDNIRGQAQFDMRRLKFLPQLKARYKNTTITLDGEFEYDGEANLAGTVEFADLADFTGQFLVRDLGGRGKAQFKVRGPLSDVNVNGTFDSDSCRFYGLAARDFHLAVDLKSIISHKSGFVRGWWKDGDLYGIGADSGYFAVAVAGEMYFLDTVYVASDKGELLGFGCFDNTSLPPQLTLTSVDLRMDQDTIRTAKEAILEIDTAEVRFKQAGLTYKGGIVNLAGNITYDRRIDLSIDLDNLVLHPLVKYTRLAKKPDGILQGHISAKGDYSAPRLDADFNISHLVLDSVLLGDVVLKTQYSNRRLHISGDVTLDQEFALNFKASLPVELALDYTGPRLPEDSMSIAFALRGRSLPIVPALVRSVESLTGDFQAEVTIGGTYRHPAATGEFKLSDGTLKVLEIVNPVTNVTISGRLEDDLIYVDQLRGFLEPPKKRFNVRSAPKAKQARATDSAGWINGGGRIRLLGVGLFDYDLALNGHDCQFYTDSYDVQGAGDLEIYVTGSSPPTVSGKVTLSRLEMREPFATFSKGVTEETEILEDSTQWNIEIEVSALNNLWVKNPEADMEMMGNVVVVREAGIYHLLGQLEIIRGNFYLFNYRFKINRGEMVFDNIREINPEINFDVTTRIRGAPSVDPLGAGSVGYEDLNLLISGNLARPEIHAAQGAIYSDEDILKMLLASRVSLGNGRSKTGMNLTDNIINNMRDYALQVFDAIEKTGMIDEFDLNPYADSLGQTRISVAKYLSPKLFLRYSRGLSGEAGEAIGLEYIFSNNLSVVGRQGPRNEGISLDLNYKYEF